MCVFVQFKEKYEKKKETKRSKAISPTVADFKRREQLTDERTKERKKRNCSKINGNKIWRWRRREMVEIPACLCVVCGEIRAAKTISFFFFIYFHGSIRPRTKCQNKKKLFFGGLRSLKFVSAFCASTAHIHLYPATRLSSMCVSIQ